MKRILSILLGLALLPSVGAHENEEPSVHRTDLVVVLEDCDDDYGWHQQGGTGTDQQWYLDGERAHDHESMEIAEMLEDGVPMIFFHGILTNKNPPSTSLNDETTIDTFRFTVDGQEHVLTLTMENDDEDETTWDLAAAGAQPDHVVRTEVKIYDEAQMDPDRFGLEWGYTYETLGVQAGDVISSLSTEGSWIGSDADERDDGITCYKGRDLIENGEGPLPFAGWTLSPEPPQVNIAAEPDAPGVGEEVTFSADVTPGWGAIESMTWDLGDGTIRSGAEVSHAYSEQGIWDVSFTVTDSLGSTVTSDLQVEMPNQAPAPDFTFSPQDPLTGEDVQFSDRSSDAEGEVVRWFWRFGDGETSSAQDPIHPYQESGIYTITLRVHDNFGAFATYQKAIQVRADADDEVVDLGEGPTADFSVTGTMVAGQTLTFTDRSTDPDGDIITFAWDFGDGATSTEQHPMHDFGSPGEYEVTLTVEDTTGLQSSTSKSVTISAPSDADRSRSAGPEAAFRVDVTAGTGGKIFQFTDESEAGDHPLAKWNWDFGDGSHSGARSPSHAYTEFGRYQVRLVVTDALGLRDASVQVLDVAAPADGNDTPALPATLLLAALLSILLASRRQR